jgi:acyl carrier protein
MTDSCSIGGDASLHAQVLNEIVQGLRKGKEGVTASSSFSELGVDSLDLAELIMEMESKYEISIPDQALEKLTTVGDAVNEVVERIKEKSA